MDGMEGWVVIRDGVSLHGCNSTTRGFSFAVNFALLLFLDRNMSSPLLIFSRLRNFTILTTASVHLLRLQPSSVTPKIQPLNALRHVSLTHRKPQEPTRSPGQRVTSAVRFQA